MPDAPPVEESANDICPHGAHPYECEFCQDPEDWTIWPGDEIVA